jgi:hypothetical protein
MRPSGLQQSINHVWNQKVNYIHRLITHFPVALIT